MPMTLSDYEFAMTNNSCSIIWIIWTHNIEHAYTRYICEGIHCWSKKVETHLFPVMDILRNCGLIWNIDDVGLLADNHEVAKPVNSLDSYFEIAMDTVQNTCALLLVASRIVWATWLFGFKFRNCDGYSGKYMRFVIGRSPNSMSQLIVLIQISKLRWIQCEIQALCYWWLAGLRGRTVEGRRVGRIFYREGPKYLIIPTWPTYV